MAYELPSFKVHIEADRITLYCHDERLIAAGLEEEYRNFGHKRVTTQYIEEFLERITAEFWNAGKKEGRKEVIGEMRKIDKLIRAL